MVNTEDRQKYFTKLFSQLKQASVMYNDEYVALISGGGVSSGLYTFHGISRGKPPAIPARYTFVYNAGTNGCVLIAHHSSILPS